jgi:hypothetical protein
LQLKDEIGRDPAEREARQADRQAVPEDFAEV